MIHLQAVRFKRRDQWPDGYPFNLALVQGIEALSFHAPVTFFVGENGSGKSTILEAIAAGASAVAVGAADLEREPTLGAARRLGAFLTLAWTNRTHRGFLFRAEDFSNFGVRVGSLMREMDDAAAEFGEKLSGYGLQLAQGSVRGQKAALVAHYGADPDARSHGESFLQFFQARFVPGGLYLLDEPDTALSPQRQLALLALLKAMVAQDAQFIIATHSPIILAYPDATILSFDGATIRKTPYDSLEGVALTRQFLASPEAFLRRL